jgi:hypothetical protein
MTSTGSIDATGEPKTTPTPAVGPVVMDPTDAILREITRGGLAGLGAGILVAGVGGRLVMRLAALLVPEAGGALTENGNAIGRITLNGSLVIVVLIGLVFGVLAGSLWVVMRPWLPSGAIRRTVVAIPIAIALGTPALVRAENRDFVVLGHDPLVVMSLVALVALFAPVLVLADRWLERHLPQPRVSDKAVIAGYATVTVLGTLLTVALVVPAFLGPALRPAGLPLMVVGAATAISWWLRGMRQRPAGRWLTIVARAALVVATLAGLTLAADEVAGALAPR